MLKVVLAGFREVLGGLKVISEGFQRPSKGSDGVSRVFQGVPDGLSSAS